MRVHEPGMMISRLLRTRFPSSQSARSLHTTVDWNKNNDFFRFSRGRFVCDEKDEMAQRHVDFDMNELCKVVASAVGERSCINVEKCADGMNNKAFLITVEGGKQVIAKVPNPNAGRRHFTTASEVATMDFARNILGVPTPQVFAFSSNSNNAIGAEYIVMEKAEGVPLEQLWPSLDFSKRAQVVRGVARYLNACSKKTFMKLGSLYYTDDLPSVDPQTPLYVDEESGEIVKSTRFAVGPTNAREWADFGRAALKCDRGPWDSVLKYRQAIAQKEIIAIQNARQLPKNLFMLCGPGLYQPTASKKLDALDAFTKVLPYILPEDGVTTRPHIWHDDLHAENIFVDPKDPSQILSVIDWQSTYIAPLFDHTIQPSFIDHDGPSVQGMEKPTLPDFPNDMSEGDKAAATAEFYDMSLVFAFKFLLQKHIQPAFQALVFNESAAADILLFSRRLFEIGEAHAISSILALQDQWHELPLVQKRGNPPFPLSFSTDHLARIDNDLQSATRSSQLMNEIKETMGDLFPEKGVVRHDQYDEAKSTLREIKSQTIGEFAHSPQDRALWEASWPFDD